MTVPAALRLLAFLAILAVVFAGGIGLGGAFGPDATDEPAPHMDTHQR